MFTIEQIKEAHSKVKSGADYPAYIKAINKLGVESYTNFVNDGNTVYCGKNNFNIQSGTKYPALDIAKESNGEKFKERLKIHQQGGSDFKTFCKDSAETGIEKWVGDLDKMTCTYFDRQGNIILVEQIPKV